VMVSICVKEMNTNVLVREVACDHSLFSKILNRLILVFVGNVAF